MESDEEIILETEDVIDDDTLKEEAEVEAEADEEQVDENDNENENDNDCIDIGEQPEINITDTVI